MRKLQLPGLGAVVLFLLLFSESAAQNTVTMVSKESYFTNFPLDSKVLPDTVQTQTLKQADVIQQRNRQREDEIHVQIGIKKSALENSTDESLKATLNDEIQQLQDELQILKSPPGRAILDTGLPELK